MKNLKLAAIVLLTSVTTILSSCSKSDPTPAAPPAAAVAPDGFTWTENGGTTVMTGATPFFVTQGHSLFVQNATGGVLFEFNFNSLAPATFVYSTSFSPGTFFVDYQFAGVTSTNRFVPTSGTCIIASNANGKISGTFTASGSAGTISSIKGAFNNINVQP